MKGQIKQEQAQRLVNVAPAGRLAEQALVDRVNGWSHLAEEWMEYE